MCFGNATSVAFSRHARLTRATPTVDGTNGRENEPAKFPANRDKSLPVAGTRRIWIRHLLNAQRVETTRHRNAQPWSKRLYVASIVSCLVVAWGLLTFSANHLIAVQSQHGVADTPRIAEIAPVGWRRTVNGWELAETWMNPRDGSARNINQWLAIHQQREASSVRACLERIRTVHPLVWSLSLLVLVWLIALAHDRNAGRQTQSQ
jgi:hypothetical protein